MATTDILKKSNLFLLSFVFIAQASSQTAPDWNYQNTDWGLKYAQCNGQRQSPLKLKAGFPIPLPEIRFANYDVPLRGDYTVINDARSISMDIPVTNNGQRPSITGGLLRTKYEAISLHFHWGSLAANGSEHLINGVRYEVEMHIVHKNIKYKTMEIASKYKDGLAVLASLFKVGPDTRRNDMALRVVLNMLPDLRTSYSSVVIEGPYSMAEFIGDVDPKNFFTYRGSLTTPPCTEDVIWNVFSIPLPMSLHHIQNFYDLLDENNQPLINTFRPLQRRENRSIFYRSSGRN